MSNPSVLIRKILPEDNTAIETIIRNVFPEFNLPLTGTAYADAETPKMFESYQGKKEVYFVIEIDGVVCGGAGIKPLNGYEASVCELQKMYYKPEIRGKGYGKLLFDQCLSAAKTMGYQKCYLETASQLKAAIQLYEKFGFTHLDKPLGNTGHFSCGIWMIKEL
ncbi:MAG TPA: GNAT family N-acetyltransferase [Flavobacteriaceae bacterium]|nr:GNAT family N-acetyltransferase [Flavobacteriaceae bacterium]